MKKRMSVMLGIPTMTNRVTIQIVGLIDALRRGAEEEGSNFDLHYTIEMGKAPVEYARNVLCGAFLRSGCDKLWFIDEDMLPEASVVRLIGSDADIICARMYKFDHPNPEENKTVGLGLCAMNKNDRGLFSPLAPSVGEPAVQDADVVGTGCTVIARHVIEDRRLWSPNVFTTMDGKTIDGNAIPDRGDYAPNIFRTVRAPNGAGLCGEDVDFCRRAKALGYSVKVDLNAICGHFKSIDIDQAGFLAQETVQRVLGGINMADGSVLKADLSAIKAVAGPSIDKMIHAGDALVKGAA